MENISQESYTGVKVYIKNIIFLRLQALLTPRNKIKNYGYFSVK